MDEDIERLLFEKHFSVLCEEHAKELEVLKVLIGKLDRALFGNGQPGIIEKHDSRIKKLERTFWVMIGFLIAINSLLSYGVFSLKALIEKR